MSDRVRDRLRVIVLGSTGSVGTQTLEVIAHLNTLHARGEHDRGYKVVGLAAGRNVESVIHQALTHGVEHVAIAELHDDARTAIEASLPGVTKRSGTDAAVELVEEVEADMVVAAIVGVAGLPATLRAVELGRDVVLANKETLVAAGELVVQTAARFGASLLPIDSEHAGVWQCLVPRSVTPDEAAAIRPPLRAGDDVIRVTLTASGGAFRDLPDDQLDDAPPEAALKHPTWDMGAKVTVDSASLTNKALELIEAHWLFGLGADRLDAVIHPTSTIHALAQFADGSVIAHLGDPDMRTPIQCALTWPSRAAGLSTALDLLALPRLEFSAIDPQRYPAIPAAFAVIEQGGTTGAVFNAANERTVEAYLAGAARFADVRRLPIAAIDAVGASAANDLTDVMAADAEARRFVDAELGVSSVAPTAQRRTISPAR
ncbi:MAG: 1-deoxy-D-xylulose-5-phosphate reductoisomerase [Acidobacteriota bacterium]